MNGSDILTRQDHLLSLRLNQLGESRCIQTGFGLVSRLGDGLIWYSLVLGLPFIMGPAFVPVSGCLAASMLSGIWVYRKIKHYYRRPRPFNADSRFLARAVALDEYSFPSGHTLHATAFFCIFLATSPAVAYAFFPFVIATAVSRVVLGMHYISDVLAGAAVGTLLGGFWLMSLTAAGLLHF